MTPEQITQLRQLEAKATKGPWDFYNGWHIMFSKDDPREIVADYRNSFAKPFENAVANADMILFLRNNALSLCDALEAERARLAEATAALEAEQAWRDATTPDEEMHLRIRATELRTTALSNLK